MRPRAPRGSSRPGAAVLIAVAIVAAALAHELHPARSAPRPAAREVSPAHIAAQSTWVDAAHQLIQGTSDAADGREVLVKMNVPGRPQVVVAIGHVVGGRFSVLADVPLALQGDRTLVQVCLGRQTADVGRRSA